MKYVLPLVALLSLGACGCSVGGSVGETHPIASVNFSASVGPKTVAAKEEKKVFSNIIVSDQEHGTASVASFGKDQDKIYVYYNFDLPVGSKVKTSISLVKATDEENSKLVGVLKDLTIPIEKPADHGDFILSKPNGGWFGGDYKVEFYADDKLCDTATFKVE